MEGEYNLRNLNFIGYPLYSITRKGEVFSNLSQRFLKNSISPTTGRYRVNLRNDEGVKTLNVHRLVALAFIPNPDNLPVVNHIDGNPLNNDVSNLEWTTHEGNSVHAVTTGLFDVRSVSTEVAHEIFSLMQSGLRNKDIHEITGVNYCVIAKMRQGENYRDIWEQYTIPCKSHTVSLSKIKYIKELLNQGLTTTDIIKKVKVRRCLVKSIRDGLIFKNLLVE